MQIRSIRKQYYRDHSIAFTRASEADKLLLEMDLKYTIQRGKIMAITGINNSGYTWKLGENRHSR